MRKLQRKRLVFSLLPLFCILVVIYIIPLANIFVNAFMGHTGSSAGKFVGLANFIRIQKDIPRTVWLTLQWTVGSVLPAMVVGLVLALLFQQNFRLKKLFTSLNLLPYSIPLIIVASCWIFMYNTNFGFINVALMKLGLISSPIQFLNYNNAMISVIMARFWRALPFAFINYYSALTTIPAEYYEAASVDGASRFQRFIHVTLPHLRSITSTTLIVLTVWTFLVFDIIYGMTGGGPVDATRTIPVQIQREMVGMKDAGTASCWSIIALVVLIAICLVYWFALVRKEDNE